MKILKVKTTEETHHIKCNFYNQGFCKAGQDCAYNHPNEDWETHMVGNICKDKVGEKMVTKLGQFTEFGPFSTFQLFKLSKLCYHFLLSFENKNIF